MSTLQKIAYKRMAEKQAFAEIKKSFTLSDGSLLYSGGLLARAAKKFPKNVALFIDEESITYKELYVRSVSLSRNLQSAGIKPRDKVFLLCENSVHFYIAYFAIWQIGAIIIPANIFLHSKELGRIIDESQPSAIFVLNKFKEKFDSLNLLNSLPQQFTEDDIDYDSSLDLLEKKAKDFEIISLDHNELALLLYTSGTSGKPKGVMLSSHNIMTNAMQCYSRLCTSYEGKERFFCVLPLFHVFAQNSCIWLPIMVGASVIVVRTIDRKLIIQGLRKKPTIFFGVPALYGLLCLMKYASLDSVKMFVSGADALPDRIRAAFALIYGRTICAGYGLTEASPVVAVNNDPSVAQTHVVGIAIPSLECDVRDDEGNTLSAGKIGTLWLKGNNIMLGYYNAPEETKKVLQNGWLNTGDLATLDANGLLAICGRSKDLIIHKGFNIYPQEIENVLMKHPAVFKVAVLGKEEQSSGQIPVAFVALKNKDKSVEKNLRILCSNNLAAYKIPRTFICLEDLPMNATGKIDKKQLNQHI